MNLPALTILLVLRIIDGDTVQVAPGLLPPELPISIRIRGIDTPESRKPLAKCDAEMALAKQAKAFTAAAITTAQAVGQWVEFSHLEWDKYGGRVLADVTISGANLGQLLIDAGYARPYFGVGPKPDWCGTPTP